MPLIGAVQLGPMVAPVAVTASETSAPFLLVATAVWLGGMFSVGGVSGVPLETTNGNDTLALFP